MRDAAPDPCSNGADRARHRVVIVGGGISGLAAALRLREAAPEVESLLLEAEPRLGGKILTERTYGFVIEGAPDSFLRSKPAGVGLAREIGMEGRLQGVREETRRTFVMRDRQLVRLPEGLSGLVPTRLGPLYRSPLLSPLGKARVSLEPIVPARPAPGDESLGSFMRRRMGSEAYERLVEPLMSGIYGGNGDDLSLRATFPRLADIERQHGSLLRGLRASAPPRPAAGAAVSPFLSPIGGMGELVETLESTLAGTRIMMETPVLSLAVHDGVYELHTQDGSRLQADAVILATPAFAAARILAEADASVAGLLGTIPYGSTVTVSLGYRDRDLARRLDGHGYIVPRRERRPILACTWTSSKFAHRAPEGFALVRGFVGGEGALKRSDEEIVDLLRVELGATLGIRAEPVLSRVFRWPHSMPQYRVGHLDLVASVDERIRGLPGLFLAGAPYSGVGIPDCIASGEAAARAAVSFLREARR